MIVELTKHTRIIREEAHKSVIQGLESKLPGVLQEGVRKSIRDLDEEAIRTYFRDGPLRYELLESWPVSPGLKKAMRDLQRMLKELEHYRGKGGEKRSASGHMKL